MNIKRIVVAFAVIATSLLANDMTNKQNNSKDYEAQEESWRPEWFIKYLREHEGGKKIERLGAALRRSSSAVEQVDVFTEFKSMRFLEQTHFLKLCKYNCLENYANTNLTAFVFDEKNKVGYRITASRQALWFIGKIVGKNLEQHLESPDEGTLDSVEYHIGIGVRNWEEKRKRELAREFLKTATQEKKLAYARSETTPYEVLEALADNPDKNIRMAVLKNKNMSHWVVNRFSESDPDDEVRNEAREMRKKGIPIYDTPKIDYTGFDYL